MAAVILEGGYWLNLEAVLFTVTLLSGIIGLVLLVVRPIRKMLRRYDSTLTQLQTAITSQSGIIKAQVKCIQDSAQDRKELRESMGLVQAALLTILKVELDKQCAKALQSGTITVERKRAIEEMFAEYQRLGGNHGMASSVNVVINLPVELNK